MYYKFYVTIILYATILVSCKPAVSEYITNDGLTQGTTYHIVYQSKNNTNYRLEIEALLKKIDLSLSTYNTASVISKINNNESFETDSFFREVFIKSVEINKLSDGVFDITVGSLVEAYGFGIYKKKAITRNLLDSLLQFVGMEKVKLQDTKIIKQSPGVRIDCNAIAQGYSVDIISEFLEKMECTNYLVEIGGEVRAKGLNSNNEIWRVGIDKPINNSIAENREIQEIIKLKNKSLATSGNYRKFYEENGIKFTHSIDPKTGLSRTDSLLSVSILANDAATADALATTCMVMGIQNATVLIKSLPDVAAYFIYADSKGNYQIITINDFTDFIEQ